MTSKQVRRLHPISVVYFLIKTIRELIVPLIFSMVGLISSLGIQGILWSLLAIVVAFVLLVVISALRYFTFSFEIRDRDIKVNSGIIVKKVNHIPYDRIQNITVNQWFFLKPLNLTQLEIETAGNDKKGPEVTLSAVDMSLKDEIEAHRNQVDELKVQAEPTTAVEPEKNKTKIISEYKISTKNLLLYSATSTYFLTAAVVLIGYSARFFNDVPEGFKDTMYVNFSIEHFGISFAIGVSLLFLLLLYLVSILLLVIRYFNFTLTKTPGRLNVKYGLIQTRTVSIETDRIQAIKIHQTWIRKLLKIETIQLVIISNSNKKDTEKNLTVMPIIGTDKTREFLAEFFEEFPEIKYQKNTRLGSTIYYNLRNALLWSLPFIVAGIAADVLVFKSFYATLAVVILCLWLVIMPSLMEALRANIFVIDQEFVGLKFNTMYSQSQVLFKIDKVQSLVKKQSVWLEKKKLASVKVHYRSGASGKSINLGYLPEKRINELMSWYRAI